MQLFQSFERILGSAESVEFTVRKTEKGLEVITTPTLKSAPTDLSDEDAEFRGALTTPLYVCEDASVLDEQFFDLLAQYVDAREPLATACDAIDDIREAGQQAKAAEKKLGTDKKGSKSDSTGDNSETGSDKAKASSGTAPAPSAASADNPDSLF